MGCAISLTIVTAPAARVDPSIILASISTSPSKFNTEPLPETSISIQIH